MENKVKDEIIVDRANRTVYVKSSGHTYDFLRMLNKGNIKINPIPDDRYTISDMYVGKAACHPEDEFDEAYGIRLATRRMQQKIYQAMSKRYDKLMDDLTLISADANHRLASYGLMAYEYDSADAPEDEDA